MRDYGPSTYGDSIADTYDAWYGEHPTTAVAVKAIERLVKERTTGRALELGIGSGRLALPLVARGIDVWGIDASTGMIDQLRAKPGGGDIPVAIGDMSALDLSSLPGGDSARFTVVFVALSTLFNLVTADAQQRCLQRVHDVLEPDGVFVVEAFVPDLERPTNRVEARTVETDHVVLTASRADPATQLVHVQVIEIRESGIKMRPLMIRYASPAELDAMASAAGLELRERWSDWDATPFADGDGMHVSVYGRKQH